MNIQIDKSKKVPLYKQIVEQIQEQIVSGEIPDGFQLPSERQLADALGVNRTTVLNAYKELKAEGFMAAHVGRGTVAVKGANHGMNRGSCYREPMWEHLYSDYLKNHSGFNINKYLEIANRKDVISFAAGIASFENPPITAFKGMEEAVLENPKALLVSPVAGFSSLRRVMSAYMQKRGCFCQPSEIMIISGAQQGIDLVGRALINPGDVVLLEEPSFFPAIQVFRAMGAKIMAIPMEDDGMNVAILEQLLARYRPKLIYTMPTYHNPCGTSMCMAKRVRLLELANKYAVPVLEDDPYSELSYEGRAASPLKSMDKSGCVIYLSTFSKTIYPGLRLGWVCANKRLISQLLNIRQLMDLHSSCISQQIAERFIVSGEMEKYLNVICKEYGERRNLMADALRQYAPPGLIWTKPAGGYYLWCKLPEGLSADALTGRAAEKGVAVLSGGITCLSGQKGDSHIRLNYTFPPKRDISRGIKILCEVIEKMVAESKNREPLAEGEISPIL